MEYLHNFQEFLEICEDDDLHMRVATAQECSEEW